MVIRFFIMDENGEQKDEFIRNMEVVPPLDSYVQAPEGGVYRVVDIIFWEDETTIELYEG